MADEIIDLTRYLDRDPGSDLARGAMALWGGDGERSRFALPLWRVIYLAQGERASIVWSGVEFPRRPEPFVVLDLGADPARTDLGSVSIPRFGVDEGPSLIDLDAEGLIVYLGSRSGRIWTLVVDGDSARTAPLGPQAREDILFLAGECAGLLFGRDLAGGPEPAGGLEPSVD